MHVRDRRRLIMAVIDGEDVLTVQHLAQRLGASYSTIWRDLSALHSDGHLIRIRGGALSSASMRYVPEMPIKGVEQGADAQLSASHRICSAHQHAIGRLALSFIKPHMSMILNGGQTTLTLASLIEDRRYHVLTASIPIFQCLEKLERIKVILPGGSLLREQSIMMSPFGSGVLASFTATRMFTDALSITKNGLMENDILVVQSTRQLMKRAKEVIVLADSSKIDAFAALSVCPLSDVNILITDEDIETSALKWLTSSGIDVRIAKIDASYT